MRKTRLLAITALLSTVMLSGCVQPPTDTPTAPTPSKMPIFANDEEALAAATDAYTAYQAVMNEISQEGGASPERIASVVTKDRLAKEIEGLQALAASGRRLVGDIVVAGVTLQQEYQENPNSAMVVIYACLDASDVRVIDAQGADVTPTEFQSPWPREVSLRSANDSTAQLLVSDEKSWTGKSSC